MNGNSGSLKSKWKMRLIPSTLFTCTNAIIVVWKHQIFHRENLLTRHTNNHCSFLTKSNLLEIHYIWHIHTQITAVSFHRLENQMFFTIRIIMATWQVTIIIYNDDRTFHTRTILRTTSIFRFVYRISFHTHKYKIYYNNV